MWPQSFSILLSRPGGRNNPSKMLRELRQRGQMPCVQVPPLSSNREGRNHSNNSQTCMSCGSEGPSKDVTLSS